MTGLAGLVLAGGLGTRLGGVAKPLLRVGGEPILSRILTLLRPHVSPLVVSTGAIAPERFASFCADALVPDLPGPSAGPLAGLFATAAFLRDTSSPPEWLLSVAGDCPDLPQDMLAVLLAAAGPDLDVVFAGFAGQAYPTNALWRFSALVAHMDALGGTPQGRGPRQLVAPQRRQDIDFARRSSTNPFEGLNNLSDLVRLSRQHRSGKAG